MRILVYNFRNILNNIDAMINNAKPFVKWVGGKTALIPTIERILPGNVNSGMIDYVEPFVGGGGFLFHMLTYHSFHKVYINDINAPLIDCYRMFQSDTQYNEFIQYLLSFEDMYNNETLDKKEMLYYHLRERYNELLKESNTTQLPNSPECCALFVFLNKTCFNGLYRTNKKEKYNVPWGKRTEIKLYNKNVFESDRFLLSKNNIDITNGDFEFIKNFRGENVLIYLDPPYAPEKKQSFTSYSPLGFNMDDQIRLRNVCNKLTSKGVKIIESNSCTTEIKKLYKNYNIKEITAPRYVSANGDSRGEVTELLITNY